MCTLIIIRDNSSYCVNVSKLVIVTAANSSKLWTADECSHQFYRINEVKNLTIVSDKLFDIQGKLREHYYILFDGSYFIEW